jgi:hypothetical protein
MRIIPFLLLAASAGAARAQTATTDCWQDGFGSTHCTTRGQPQPDHTIQDFVNGYQRSSQAATDAQIEAMRRYREQHRAAVADEQTKVAARMIIDGDCPGAEQYALGAGNIELAREVKDYCAR